MPKDNVVGINKNAALLLEFSNTIQKAVRTAYLIDSKRDKRRARAFYVIAAIFLALIFLRPATVNSREDVVNLQTELKSLLPSGPVVSDPGEFVRGGII